MKTAKIFTPKMEKGFIDYSHELKTTRKTQYEIIDHDDKADFIYVEYSTKNIFGKIKNNIVKFKFPRHWTRENYNNVWTMSNRCSKFINRLEGLKTPEKNKLKIVLQQLEDEYIKSESLDDFSNGIIFAVSKIKESLNLESS